jgi:ankyrin repeat protein
MNKTFTTVSVLLLVLVIGGYWLYSPHLLMKKANTSGSTENAEPVEAPLIAALINAETDERARVAVAARPPSMLVTPLLDAVGAGDVTKVRELLEAGANPDDPTAARMPLFQAIMSRVDGNSFRCNLPIVQLLLKHGANPNRADPYLGTIPLIEAFGIGDLKCAEIIHAAGAPADTRTADGYSILHVAVGAAARSGDMSLIDTALSWGVPKDAQRADGSTALHDAVDVRSDRAVKALLDRGFDPCIKDKAGGTPLHLAENLYSGRTGPNDKEILSVLRAATNCK